jgi:hypothetical protein
MTLELVYIGHHTSRFIYGQIYIANSFTVDTTTILDKDRVPMSISNDILHLHFRQKAQWREEQIDKILSI